MPLLKNRSKAAVSKNISKLVHEGRSQAQAIAIALSVAGKGRRKTNKRRK